MRLGILLPLASPWARNVVWNLASVGHKVHVFTFGGKVAANYFSLDDQFQRDELNAFHHAARVRFLDGALKSRLRYITAARRLRRGLEEVEAECLLTLYGGGFALTAILSGFRPFAVYLVGSDVLQIGRLGQLVSRIALSKADVVLANGQALAQAAQSVFGKAVRPMYLPIDLDLDKYRKTPQPSPTQPVRMICTRGFTAVYNNEYLIRGLAALDDQIPSARFEMIFTSPGPLLEQTRHLAHQMLPSEMATRVHFLGGLQRDELLRCLASSDIFISLSRSDGTSTSLLEALTLGVYPLVSDIAANREWIDVERGNGILVPLDDPSQLATSLREVLLNGRTLRARFAESNRRLVQERVDAQQNAKQLGAILEQL